MTPFILGVLDSEQIIKALDTYKDYLVQGSPFWDILRPLGMKIAEGGAWLLDGLTDVIGNLVKLLNIFDNSKFQELVATVVPFKWFLLMLFLLGFFILLAFNKAKDAHQAPLNLLLLICMTIMLPFLVSTMSNTVQEVFPFLTQGAEKPGTKIILDNTTDLKILAEDGWTLKVGENKNHYKKVRQVNMTEKISDPNKQMNGIPFGQSLVADSKGNDALEEIKGPMLGIDMLSKYYYRNKVRFFQIYLTQIISILALAFSAFKFAIIINKMFGDYILLITAGIADFSTMQRAKAVFSELAGSFALLIYVPILFKIYLTTVSIISTFHFDFFTYIFAMAGAGWALIDGPNGFQRVTGIDAGLRSAGAIIAGTLGGSKLISMTKHAVDGAARSAGSLLTDAGAFSLGMANAKFGDSKKKGGINEEDTNNDDREENEFPGINENEERPNDSDSSKDKSSENAEGKDSENSRESGSDSDDSEPKNTDETENKDYANGLNGSSETNEKESEQAFGSGINQLQDNEQTAENDVSIQEPTISASETDVELPKERMAMGQSNAYENELRELKKTNPIRQGLKNKIFGLPPDDPRRHYKQTTMEKKRDKYYAGKNYIEYRQKRKELKKKINEHE